MLERLKNTSQLVNWSVSTALFSNHIKVGLLVLVAIITVGLCSANQAWAVGSDHDKGSNDKNCEAVLDPAAPIRHELVKIDKKTYEYKGLTEEGLRALKNARDTLRERAQLFDNEIRSMGSIHHAGVVARLFKGNMFLYGPPGGAKSMFVNWIMRGEKEGEGSFKLQLHQMITEQAFIGGQNFDAAQRGEFDLNTKGSLADTAVALIDEVEKGNPAALSALLSLLNEREILAGNKVVKARLTTLFATSNASLPEIFEQFVASDQGSTAPALLNRFQFKAFVYNWLSRRDQVILDRRKSRKEYLSALAEMYPDVHDDEVFLEPKPLNWAEMRVLAKVLFKADTHFMNFYREFVDDLREQTNKAIKHSEERHQQNHLDEPFVYFPSADFTERLRQQVPHVVMMSAFVDFLLSDLASDESLENMTTQPITLGPLSLWRSYLVFTTLGPGQAGLQIDSGDKDTISIDFGDAIDRDAARDQRESLLITNLQNEQERFERTFKKHLEPYRENIVLRAKHSKSSSSDSEESVPFEIMLKEMGGDE